MEPQAGQSRRLKALWFMIRHRWQQPKDTCGTNACRHAVRAHARRTHTHTRHCVVFLDETGIWVTCIYVHLSEVGSKSHVCKSQAVLTAKPQASPKSLWWQSSKSSQVSHKSSHSKKTDQPPVSTFCVNYFKWQYVDVMHILQLLNISIYISKR